MSTVLASKGRVKPTKQISMIFLGPTTRREVPVDIYWGDDLRSRFEKEIQAAQSVFEGVTLNQLIYSLCVAPSREDNVRIWTGSLDDLVDEFETLKISWDIFQDVSIAVNTWDIDSEDDSLLATPRNDNDVSPYTAKRVEIDGTVVQPYDTVNYEEGAYILALNIQDRRLPDRPFIDPAFKLWYDKPPSEEQAMKDLRLLARQEAVLPQWGQKATERLQAILEMIEVAEPFYYQESFKDMGTPYRDCADVERSFHKVLAGCLLPVNGNLTYYLEVRGGGPEKIAETQPPVSSYLLESARRITRCHSPRYIPGTPGHKVDALIASAKVLPVASSGAGKAVPEVINYTDVEFTFEIINNWYLYSSQMIVKHKGLPTVEDVEGWIDSKWNTARDSDGGSIWKTTKGSIDRVSFKDWLIGMNRRQSDLEDGNHVVLVLYRQDAELTYPVSNGGVGPQRPFAYDFTEPHRPIVFPKDRNGFVSVHCFGPRSPYDIESFSLKQTVSELLQNRNIASNERAIIQHEGNYYDVTTPGLESCTLEDLHFGTHEFVDELIIAEEAPGPIEPEKNFPGKHDPLSGRYGLGDVDATPLPSPALAKVLPEMPHSESIRGQSPPVPKGNIDLTARRGDQTSSDEDASTVKPIDTQDTSIPAVVGGGPNAQSAFYAAARAGPKTPVRMDVPLEGGVSTPTYLDELASSPNHTAASTRLLRIIKEESVKPASSLGLKLLGLVQALQTDGELHQDSPVFDVQSLDSSGSTEKACDKSSNGDDVVDKASGPDVTDASDTVSVSDLVESSVRLSVKSSLEPIEDRLNDFAAMLNTIAEAVGVNLLEDDAREAEQEYEIVNTMDQALEAASTTATRFMDSPRPLNRAVNHRDASVALHADLGAGHVRTRNNPARTQSRFGLRSLVEASEQLAPPDLEEVYPDTQASHRNTGRPLRPRTPPRLGDGMAPARPHDRHIPPRVPMFGLGAHNQHSGLRGCQCGCEAPDRFDHLRMLAQHRRRRNELSGMNGPPGVTNGPHGGMDWHRQVPPMAYPPHGTFGVGGRFAPYSNAHRSLPVGPYPGFF